MTANAQWHVDFKVRPPCRPFTMRTGFIYQDGEGVRGSLYLASPDLAKAGAAYKRAADSARKRVAKAAGVSERAVSILTVRCVG